MKRLRMPLRAGIVVGAVTVALAAAVYALAGHEEGSVASYTGCLKNGTFKGVAVGNTPAAPCAASEVQVHLSGGDITSVRPRLGLQGGGTEGAVEIGPDTSVLQSRVTGSCLESGRGPIDASISAIARNGTVTCNPDDQGPATSAFSGFWDGPEPLPLVPNPGVPPAPIAQLAVPEGSFVVFAKLAAVDLQGDEGFSDFVRCRLSAGADFDRSFVTLGPDDIATLALGVVHTFPTADNVVVACAGTESANWAFLKVTASRVSELSNGPLTLLPG
jgi:hypothetical protein